MMIFVLNVKIEIMKREDIEKKSQECAERLANIAYAGGGHIGQDDLEEAFIIGANWRINSVWHDASESPKKKGYILVQINEEYPIYVVWSINSTDWDKTAERANAVKWAYIEDLLPIK